MVYWSSELDKVLKRKWKFLNKDDRVVNMLLENITDKSRFDEHLFDDLIGICANLQEIITKTVEPEDIWCQACQENHKSWPRIGVSDIIKRIPIPLELAQILFYEWLEYRTLNDLLDDGRKKKNAKREPDWEKLGMKVETVVGGGKIGRNDPCPCGSGRKYKKCCYRKKN